jgi:DNA-binding NtrC family response regulator
VATPEGAHNPARSVLVVLASREESASLRRILSGSGWDLRVAPAFPDAEAALRTSSFAVVICAARFEDGHRWQDVLNEVQQMPVPPQLIVADRLADEALWAEVLNCGCYDLLMTPFEAEEVLRVVPMACDFWKRELGRAAAHPVPAEP